MAEPIYQFTAPNGVVYRIGGAPDEDAARLRARQYFRDEFPEQFAEWERSQPPAGFLAGVGRSFRSALGGQVAGAGLQLEERGLPGGETLRGAGEAITGQAAPGERLLEAGTVLDDLRQRPVATALTGLGQAVGSVAGSIVAPLAIAGGAAAAGASAPVVAGAGLAAGIASGAFGGTGELYQMLVAEGVAPERARTLAANVGAAIGAAEGGAAVPIARQILGTAVRRETAERLAEVAARSATGAGLREAGRGAVIEGGSEAAGGAARQAVVAAETGNVDLARRAGEVAFEGVLGAVGGAGVAGAAGTRAPARARAEIEARLTPEERAARQAAAEQPPEAEAAPPEPPPGPVLPDAPLPVESAEQANEIIAARGLRLPEGIDDTGRIAAANIALNNEYRAEVDRIRNNELDTFLGRSQLQPAAEGAPQDLAPAADALTRNVLTAIGEGRLSEPRFTSRQITDLALENLGDAGPVPVRTRTQVKKYLDALQEAGYLQSAGKIGKDVAYTLPLRQAEAVAATAAPAPVVSEAPVAPPVVNVEPEVPAAPPVAQAITLTDLATNPQSASQFLNRAFAQNPGAINSVQSLQAAARNEGLVLPPDLATGLFAQAKQSGILSPTNLYVPPAKRAQRQQAPAAAAATQALNQIAQTGTPATISPQAAQQTAAAQQASEDLQQAVRATPAPTLPRQLQALPGSVPAGTIIEVNYGGQQYTLRGTGARPTVAPTQEPLAQWQIDNMNAARDLLQRAPALGQRIRELHNQGMVARDIASTLNLDVSDVRAMRDALGLRPLGPTVTPGGAVIPEEGGQPTQPPPSLAGVQTRGAPARTEAEQAEARQAFERVVGPRGRLTFEQTLFLQDLGAEVQAAAQAAGITGPIAGYASGDLAVLSLADSTMPLNQVAIHEGWHVAENIGIIKANDIAILNASRGTILNRIRNDLDFVADPDSLSNDEVRAYGANARVSRGTDFGGTVNAIYDRLANFVDRLRNFVAGRGFNSWRDVYDNFLSGRTASLSMPGESTTYGSTVNFASPDQKLAIISAEANLQYEQGLITAAERDAKIAAAGGLRYEVIDGRTGAVVGTYSNLARARNEADKRDAQYGAVRHRVKKISVATQKPINFAAPRPVSTPQQMQQATQQYFENQIRGPAKWFSSLDLSIAKDRPALRPAADNMQTFRLSRNEANADLEPRLEKLARLSPESSRKVMRVWQTASMTETAPNVSTLNAEERAALTDAMAGIQRAFDWLIEGYVSDYYTPNAKMPAAEQARLNAFWQRNSGKHLWEIPARELQAASPKGYQEYQRLNRMRNPYKLPAVADGSHFVAVYKRNAAGQREGKPVAMIAYTPRGRWQKLMRVPDPEVIARNELQRLYPNTTTHIVMQRGQQFTQGAEAGGIRSVGDAVTQFLSGLTSLPQFANSAGARNKLQSLLDTLNKQQIERVFRRSDDVLLAVNDLTDTSYGLDALPRYLLGISNIQARRRTQNDWAEAIKPLTPDDKKYLNDLRDYASTPTESFAGIRSLTFFSLLGFAPDSMAINMLQTVQATMPMLLRDGGVGALRHFGRAYKELTQATGQATKSLLSSNRQNPVDIMTNILRDPQELADYKKALNVGTLLPLYLNESRGQVSVAAMRRLGFRNPEQRAKNFNNVLRLSGGMQAFAEQTNRAVSFLAAYRAAKADPQIIANKNRTDNLQLQTPYDYATSIVNDTHFVTDKSDRALYQRFTPAAEVVTQFMSFVTKTIELYVRQAKLLYRGIAQSDIHLARAGAVGFIGMVAPIVALAGIWALPGAEFLKEALEALVGAVWGTTQNFDADMRRAVGGGFIGEAFSAGLPSTVGLASLSKRLALDPVPFNDIKSMEVFSLMGPSGSFIEKIGQFYNYMAQGDIANALVAFPLMPRAAGNIIKGVDIGLGSETIRSQRGNVLISPEQIAEIDSQNLVPVSVRQAIGLPSPAVMSLREALVRREELAKQNSVATTRFNNTAAGYYTDALRAQREGDNDRAARAFQRLQQHIRSQVEANAEAANAGRLDAIININMTAIRRRAYEDLMGRTSPQLGLRGVPQNIRPRAQEELQLYNWRGIGAPSN